MPAIIYYNKIQKLYMPLELTINLSSRI